MGTMKLSEVAKSTDIRDLPKSEQDSLIRRKKLNRRLSQVGGATGVAALTLRTPQFARVAGSRSARLKSTKAMAHLARMEPKATKVSDAVGVTAIGTGAINSFNWAKIQAMETKADQARQKVAKFNPLSAPKIAGAIEDGLPVPAINFNEKRKDRKKRKGELVPVTKAALKSAQEVKAYAATMGKKRKPRLNPMGRYIRTERATPMDPRFWDWVEGKIGKADKFLAAHRDRISPDAERGYRYLKAGRNKHRRNAAGMGALTGINAASAAHQLGRPVIGSKTKMRAVRDAAGKVNVLEDKVLIRGARRNPVYGGAAALVAAGTGAFALDHARTAHRWNSKMGKIEARAKQRARDGQWGRDRRGDIAKALVPTTAIKRSYGARAGGLVRRGSKTWTRRGSIQGSGRLFR